MSDLKLATDHDLDVSENDLIIIDGQTEIKQSLKTRLLMVKGDWYLDTTTGLPYYEDIWVKNPNLANIDALIKAEILDTPGVTGLIAYDSEFDDTLRKLTVSFTVDTNNGQIPITEIL